MRLIVISLLISGLLSLAQAADHPQDDAVHPRWSLHWVSGKGSFWVDQPNCHPSDYFLSNPKQFDYGQDLFGEKPTAIKDTVKEENVGEIEGFAIRQVLHAIPRQGWNLFIKIILVERKAHEFCDIFNAEYDASMESIDPAYIVEINSQKVLVTHDRVSGTGNWYVEQYWTFGKDGPVPLELSIVEQTLKKLLPAGREVRKGGGFDVERLCYAMPVWQREDANGSPSAGVVQLRFELQGHQLVVVKQRYDPQPSPEEQENPMTCTQ